MGRILCRQVPSHVAPTAALLLPRFTRFDLDAASPPVLSDESEEGFDVTVVLLPRAILPNLLTRSRCRLSCWVFDALRKAQSTCAHDKSRGGVKATGQPKHTSFCCGTDVGQEPP
jgi:hypothetical protein